MPVSTFSLKVIASDKVFFEGRCQSLVVPAHDGEKGILPHHEEMVMAVREGTVRIRLEDGAILYAVIGIGFVHVANNRVILLVDTAERPEDIDRKRAEEAKERAEEQLRQKQSIQEYHISQASLARAIARLKASARHTSQGL